MKQKKCFHLVGANKTTYVPLAGENLMGIEFTSCRINRQTEHYNISISHISSYLKYNNNNVTFIVSIKKYKCILDVKKIIVATGQHFHLTISLRVFKYLLYRTFCSQ